MSASQLTTSYFSDGLKPPAKKSVGEIVNHGPVVWPILFCWGVYSFVTQCGDHVVISIKWWSRCFFRSNLGQFLAEENCRRNLAEGLFDGDVLPWMERYNPQTSRHKSIYVPNTWYTWFCCRVSHDSSSCAWEKQVIVFWCFLWRTNAVTLVPRSLDWWLPGLKPLEVSVWKSNLTIENPP